MCASREIKTIKKQYNNCYWTCTVGGIKKFLISKRRFNEKVGGGCGGYTFQV